MITTNTQQRDALYAAIVEGTPRDICARYESLVATAASTYFGVLDADVVVLDTETTGVSFKNDELTQIAAARTRAGKITEWFVTFVNPGQSIPDDIVHLTHITDEDVVDAPTPAEALTALAQFIGKSDIVAHNSEFDKSFVTRHEEGACLLENTWIDSLDLARIALPRLRSHRLIDLVNAFGAPISTHRADADVEALCFVYRILLAAVAAMPPSLVAEIAQMTTADQWSTVQVFKCFAEGKASAGNECTQVGEKRVGEQQGGEHGVEEGAAVQSEDTTIQGVEATRLPFSLRSMRAGRVNELKRVKKQDAEEIAAEAQRGLVFPTAEEVCKAFTAEGTVGSLYSDYEYRHEQSDMAEAVRSAFEQSTNLAVEAGTGVGKSMAYLLPAALFAKRSGVAVGVATKTNALLDQLVNKELPLLRKAFANEAAKGGAAATETTGATDAVGAAAASEATETTGAIDTTETTTAAAASETSDATDALTFASLKGFTHYPCLRAVQRVVEQGPGIRVVAKKELHQAPALAGLLSYIEQSEYDDIDALKIDFRALPRFMVTTTSHDCLRRKCPYYGAACFVHGARRKAESADIVVTNHSLLFCDIAADGGLLPPIRHWVVDEAHGAETEARQAFSIKLEAEAILKLAARVSSDDASSNMFIRAERKLGTAPDGSTLLYALTGKARSCGKEFAQAASELCTHIRDLLYFDTSKKSKNYDIVELWINKEIRGSATFETLVSFGRVFEAAADKLIRACQDLVAYLEDLDSVAEIQRELSATVFTLKDMASAANTILVSAPNTYAYAATLSKKKDKTAECLHALLVDVGDKLNETLYANTHSVVFASATITVKNEFTSFAQAVGLNRSEMSEACTCELPSSYNFDENMTIYVPSDIPEPNDPQYLSALQDLMIGAHRAQGGAMLSLFTNRKDMERCFEVVQPAIKSDGLRLVCQKWGVSVKGLRDDFLRDESLSLFALKSFWEGFDAPGSTLRGVIIPKLPFAKPSDPLSCERAERDPHAWNRYVLPSAVIETKQAAGRLIRKATDSGVLILADRRLLTKGYGKTFLASMPSKTIRVCTMQEIFKELSERAQG